MAHRADAATQHRGGDSVIQRQRHRSEVLNVDAGMLSVEVVPCRAEDGLGLQPRKPVDDPNAVNADVEHLTLGLDKSEALNALFLLANNASGQCAGPPLCEQVLDVDRLNPNPPKDVLGDSP